MADIKIDNKTTDAFTGYAQDREIIRAHANHQGVSPAETIPTAPGETAVYAYDFNRAPITMRMGRITGAVFDENLQGSVTTKSATYKMNMLSGWHCTLRLSTTVYGGGQVVNSAESACTTRDGETFDSLTTELAYDVGQAFATLRRELEQNGVLVTTRPEASTPAEEPQPAQVRVKTPVAPASQSGESSYNSTSSSGLNRQK